MKTEQVFRRFRRMPEMRWLVEQCYLDEDLMAAAERFYHSSEFRVAAAIARRCAGPPGLLLDLGAGSGFAALAWEREGYRVVAVDSDGGGVVGLGAIAPYIRRRDSAVRLCRASMESLPFQDGEFDVVYMRQALHHAPDLRVVCGEVCRVLKPGGLFLATREHVISRRTDLGAFLRDHPVHRYTGGERAHLLSDYTEAIESAGLRRAEVIGPWQSILNYYPLSHAAFRARCRTVLAAMVGYRPAGVLVRLRSVQRVLARYLSRTDQTPGRMYSFIAAR